MSRRRARAIALTVLLLGVSAVGVSVPPGAAASPAPSITLDHDHVHSGARIIVTLNGWPLNDVVTISVCGNAARRGSVDCNLAGSLGYGISPFDKIHRTYFVVNAPPKPCPCLIRASNATQALAATMPIVISDIGMAPVEGTPVLAPLEVSVRVRRASQTFGAWLRSLVGGPTSYDLTVALRNKSAADVTDIRLHARVGRSAIDQARLIKIKPPELVAGSSWTHTQRVTLSAPVLGRFKWTVNVTGPGDVAMRSVSTSRVPWGLFVLAILFVGDVAWYCLRRLRRETQRRRSGKFAQPSHRVYGDA